MASFTVHPIIMTLQHCTKGTDVTKCYQQAAGIALMICDELERHLFGTYVCTLGSTTFVGEDDPQVIAIELTNGYLKWMEKKIDDTSYEVL